MTTRSFILTIATSMGLTIIGCISIFGDGGQLTQLMYIPLAMLALYLLVRSIRALCRERARNKAASPPIDTIDHLVTTEK